MIRRMKRAAKARQKRVRVTHIWLGDQTIDLDLCGTVIPMPVKNMRVVIERHRTRYFCERRERIVLPVIGAPLSPDVWGMSY
jgi:hypothetical protein